MFDNTETYLFILSKLRFKDIIRIGIKRVFSVNNYFILQRTLNDLPTLDAPRLDLKIEIIRDEDFVLINKAAEQFNLNDKKELIYRMSFFNAGFKNCYLAKDKSGEIAYMQWLILPQANMQIRKTPLTIYFPLHEKQVNVSNAFTFPKYRGFNLMSYITVRLLSIAKDAGYKSAITYIKASNLEALNAIMKINFKLTDRVREIKILGFSIIFKV